MDPSSQARARRVNSLASSLRWGHSAMIRRAFASLGSFVFGLLHRSIVLACGLVSAPHLESAMSNYRV